MRHCGFAEIDCASSAEEAMEKMICRRYGLIMCDVNMPVISGVQLLKWTRQSRDVRDATFVLMTATPDREIIAAAMDHGADALIVKPFTAAVLKMKIEDIIRRKAAA